MSDFRLLSASEQVAAHLREEILRGRWTETIPGVQKISEDLGVNHKTVSAALTQLEREGVLDSAGVGRRRRIVPLTGKGLVRPMRVGLFYYNKDEDEVDPVVVQIRHALMLAGHLSVVAPKSLTELKMSVDRISRIVRKTNVDAWVVLAANRDVLEWFASLDIPSFAVGGRQEGVAIAGSKLNTRDAIEVGLKRLIDLGHRRISYICRSVRRKPEPGRTERFFLASLAAQGIAVGDYNLPDWEESPDGLRSMLASLFKLTPPTALWVDEPVLYSAVHQFIVRTGLRIPEDVSMVCLGDNLLFTWCEPSVSHVTEDRAILARAVIRWLAKTSIGKTNLRQSLVRSRFVEGGSIGPARD